MLNQVCKKSPDKAHHDRSYKDSQGNYLVKLFNNSQLRILPEIYNDYNERNGKCIICHKRYC